MRRVGAPPAEGDKPKAAEAKAADGAEKAPKAARKSGKKE